MESFSDKMKKIDQLIQKEKDLAKKVTYLTGMIKIANSSYTKDMNELLSKYGVLDDFKLWRDTSLEFLKDVDSYDIDVQSNKIILNLGKDKIEEPLSHITNYVNSKSYENAYEKTFIIAFLSVPENNLYYQIVHSIIDKE